MASSQLENSSSAQPGSPPQIGSADQMGRVAEVLRAGLPESSVQQALCQAGYTALSNHRKPNPSQEDLPALAKVFVLGQPIETNFLDSRLKGAVSDFLALGLLRVDNGYYRSTVFVYPVDEFVIASDLPAGPPGLPIFEDSVFPALETTTIDLQRFIPSKSYTHALDLGCGAGLTALHLTATSSHVIASDINPRSLAFAEFNARLNGREIEFVAQDLYGDLSRKYDLIVTFPPSTPAEPGMAKWRNGGTFGEDVLRRAVSGLQAVLNPGGRFLCRLLGFDTQSEPLHNRIRNWLASSEFDIILATDSEMELTALEENVRAYGLPSTGPWRAAFESAHATRIISGVLEIQRHTKAVQPLTLRTERSAKTSAASFDLAFEWSARAQLEPFADHDPSLKIVLAPAVEINGNGLLHTDFPFSHSIQVDPPTLHLFYLAKIPRGISEFFALAKVSGSIPSEITEARFNTWAAMLVARGFLQLTS